MIFIIIAAILIIAVFFTGAGVLFLMTIPRSKNNALATKMSGGSWDKHLVMLDESKKWLEGAECEPLQMTGFDGTVLAGYYYPAHNNNGCLVMAFNGYRSDSRGQYSHITRFLNGLGYDVVLIDDRAHGSSGGKYVGFGVLDRFDCAKWAKYIDEKFRSERKIYLYGVSMGAASVVLAGALELPETVKGIIADCGFTSPYDVFKHVLHSWYHIPSLPLLQISNLYCRVFAGYGYKDANAADAAAKSKIPLLVIHGGADTFVPTYMGREIYNASASVHKKLVIVDDACHAESYFIDMERYRREFTDFIKETKNLK